MVVYDVSSIFSKNRKLVMENYCPNASNKGELHFGHSWGEKKFPVVHISKNILEKYFLRAPQDQRVINNPDLKGQPKWQVEPMNIPIIASQNNNISAQCRHI